MGHSIAPVRRRLRVGVFVAALVAGIVLVFGAGRTEAQVTGDCFNTPCTLPDGSSYQFAFNNNMVAINFSGPSFGGTGSINYTAEQVSSDLLRFFGTQTLNGQSTNFDCTFSLSAGQIVGGTCGEAFGAVIGSNVNSATGTPAAVQSTVVANTIETTTRSIVRDQVRTTNALLANRLRNITGQIVRSRATQVSQGSTMSQALGMTGLSAGSHDARFGAWLDASVTLLDNDNVQVRTDGFSEVALVGLDYRVTNDLIVGLSAGYQGAQLDVKTIRGRRESDGWVVTPYASWIFAPNLSLDASFGIAGANTDVRNGLSGVTTTGSFDSHRYTGTLNANAYLPAGNWFLSWFAGFSYSYETQDDYTDSAGARIDNDAIRYGVMRVGGEAAYRLGMFEPYALAVFELETEETRDGTDTETLIVGGGLRFMTGPLTAAVEATAQTLRDNENNYTFGFNLRYVF